MILSVPEGDDKPLKYPLMFEVSDILIVNKIDTLPVFDFDFDALEKAAKERNPNIQIFPVSSVSGEGFNKWIRELKIREERFRENSHE